MAGRDAVRRFESSLDRYVRELLRDADRAQRSRARARRELEVNPPDVGRSPGEAVASLMREPDQIQRSRPEAG